MLLSPCIFDLRQRKGQKEGVLAELFAYTTNISYLCNVKTRERLFRITIKKRERKMIMTTVTFVVIAITLAVCAKNLFDVMDNMQANK